MGLVEGQDSAVVIVEGVNADGAVVKKGIGDLGSEESCLRQGWWHW